MRNRLTIIGAPSSAGAFSPGQEKAPAALRRVGLADQLSRSGLDVADYGDVRGFRWQPDRANPYAQNLAEVVSVATEVAAAVRQVVASDRVALVLGGDCTIELGTIAGHLPTEERVGLIYFDMHADLNVPDSKPPGALDWMGMAHALGSRKAIEALSRFGPRYPLLSPEQVLLFSHRKDQATPWELDEINRFALHTIPLEQVAHDPDWCSARAISLMEARCDRILVHLDVDVIDFTDAPLSENTGRNIGLTLDTTLRALSGLLKTDRLSALTITELNPDHGEPGYETLKRFAQGLSNALVASANSTREGAPSLDQ